MSTNNEVVVEAKHLAAGYGRRLVLENINFQVRRGEVFAIVGRSGSGKTTLLKQMIGLSRPLEGEVWIEGRNLVTATGEERKHLLRRLGVLYQSSALFGSMTVLENVRLALDEFTNLPAQAKDLVAVSKLKLVGLAETAQAMPSELSGGMQKRAAIARAMALDPDILFLDEPSAGLDPITTAEMNDLIKKLSSYFGITFVIVSHNLPAVEAVASRMIMLDEQARTVIAEGAPAGLREHATDPRVRRFFHPAPGPMASTGTPR